MKKPKLALLVAGTLAALLGFKVNADLSETEAQKYVKQGVLVVDVRTVQEYETKHLTNVINIPLDEVKQKFPTMITNKAEIVLLHCRSGRRSSLAEQELRALGYTNVFNIGSYEQARKIVEGSIK